MAGLIKKFARAFAGLMMAAFGLPVLIALADSGSAPPPRPSRQVFIAFGFHVNLYHSFRNDTPDEEGFGKDIRIIRHIIRALDRCNAEGIPVKGVWDFDNLFSLQEILPRHAPDIIENIRRRVREHGDEIILMSFNNGMVSAMTPQELDDAVRWSISNPWGSGVLDIFGTYTPIVRPQEMMTTPGNFSVYRKHGIQAVALYYSATPFDAFRVFTRPLSRAEAHNPILYHHPETSEEMVVIPTYHFGDLMEHVSLRRWASELRALQANGELDRDALIFINFDADAEVWAGIDLPWFMRWLPNTGGLEALIREVAGLPGVRFSTLGEYLNGRPPAGTFFFSQDTADGSFNGYSSWSEKADSPRYWTSIERSRRVGDAALAAAALLPETAGHEQLRKQIAAAGMKRLRALSTTHFGMATPFLAPQRERVIAELAGELDGSSDAIEALLADALRAHLHGHAWPEKGKGGRTLLDTVMVPPAQPGSTAGTRFLNLRELGYFPGDRLVLTGDDGNEWSATPLNASGPESAGENLLLFIEGPAPLPGGIYRIWAETFQTSHPTWDERQRRRDGLWVKIEEGRLEGIYLDGIRQVETGSLSPYMLWGGRIFSTDAELTAEEDVERSRRPSFRMSGPLPGPPSETIADGRIDYRFILFEGMPYMMVEADIAYPKTKQGDLIKASAPGLRRWADLQWQEAAPAEIRFAPRATRKDPVRILKENYLGVSTSYALDYHHHSARNLNLGNVNNHITSAYVGVTAGGRGMAVAMDTGIRSSFAFSPLRLRYEPEGKAFAVRLNPFGTYDGRQYTPPTWGNRTGFDATLLAGEQFAGAGPTYNGAAHSFRLLLAFFHGNKVPDAIRRDLNDFARPPLVISSKFTMAAAPLDNLPSLREAPGTPEKSIPVASYSERPPTPPLNLTIRVLWANLRAMRFSSVLQALIR